MIDLVARKETALPTRGLGRLSRTVLGLGLWLLGAGPCLGHDARPLYVEITEVVERVFVVSWKAPDSMPAAAMPDVIMPAECSVDEARGLRQYGDGYVSQRTYRCADGLSGQTLGLSWPHINPSLSALFRLRLGNGETHSRILAPGETAWQVPEAENPWQVSRQYTQLGIEHIFAGVDHLLFVACLVFIARTRKRILITITGFTVAHSLTLALSTLGVVSLPITPVEAVIALSILFLAHEIAVANHNSWTWRYPVLVSSSFGLLHGFGFASVLGDIGLPQVEKALALLCFNLGVEIGQILFVLGLAGLNLMFKTLPRPSWSRLSLPGSRLAGYGIGGLAGFWFIQRLAGF